MADASTPRLAAPAPPGRAAATARAACAARATPPAPLPALPGGSGAGGTHTPDLRANSGARRSGQDPAPVAGAAGAGHHSAAQIAVVIKAQRYRYATEAHLQEGIAGALAAAGISAEREVRLAGPDRIDFMAGNLGIEVKIAGQSAAVARQLGRYAKSEAVAELMLVTTRARHRDIPREIDGKPVHVVLLSGITS